MKVANILHKLEKNAPTILTCVGAVGVVATSVLTAKATVKATKLLEEAQEEKGEQLTEMEIVQIAGPSYIPAIAVGVSSIACILGANLLSKRSQASLMSAYALVDSTFREYKNKVIEMNGEEMDGAVRTEIAKDHYKESDIDDEDDGKTLFYDEYSQRYFRATNETVLRAEYEINKMVSEDCYACLNDWYDLIDIPRVSHGDQFGWASGQLYDHNWSSWIHFSHKKVEMDDGLECYIISMTDPLMGFEDY